MKFDWHVIVDSVIPGILAMTPLAPLAPYVALGIKTAEQIKGATGEQKLNLAAQIATVGVAATNAQAGKEIVNPEMANQLIVSSINAIVAAANLKHKA